MIQFVLLYHPPTPLGWYIVGIQLASYSPQLFPGMIQIDDLRGLREMHIGGRAPEAQLVPYPFRAVSQNDPFLRAAPSPPPSFRIEPAAEFLGSLDSAHIGGRVFVSYGIPFLVHRRLRKYATDLCLPGMPRLTVLFARTSFGFLTYDGNTCAVHLHVEDGNPWSQGNR